MKKKRLKIFLGVAAALLVLVVAIWFFSATGNIRAGQQEAGRQQLETALRRAAVACYAAEVIYPPTVQYLTDHYGIRIDREKYHVFYEVFAENLMPDITVLIAQ